ncbi:hypothetical protein EHS25_007383 [Saitozyma podzolica]|uniref:Uncharacterized protein n=1 Tax=Saitozyma podzolica TaxID=1890683 RepID=A0A427YPP6_9TREE|nr:hypothetical protein EHS25_007383 [Saitozyma podzolica]
MEAWSKELKRHEEVEAGKSATVAEELDRRVERRTTEAREVRDREREELNAVETRIEAVCRDREAEKSKLSRVLGGLEMWMDTMIASLRRDLDRRDAQLEQLHINLGFLIRDRNNIHGEVVEQHVEATFKPGQPMYTRLETSDRTMANKAIEHDTSILARSLNVHRADMAQLQLEVDDNLKQVAALPTHLGKVSAKVKSLSKRFVVALAVHHNLLEGYAHVQQVDGDMRDRYEEFALDSSIKKDRGREQEVENAEARAKAEKNPIKSDLDKSTADCKTAATGADVKTAMQEPLRTVQTAIKEHATTASNLVSQLRTQTEASKTQTDQLVTKADEFKSEGDRLESEQASAEVERLRSEAKVYLDRIGEVRSARETLEGEIGKLPSLPSVQSDIVAAKAVATQLQAQMDHVRA